MKRKPIALIIATVFATIVLALQFLRISVISGEFVMQGQLPLHAGESASLLTIVESVIAILIPATLVVFFILLIMKRSELYLKLMLIPVSLLIISALQKTFYILMYEGAFSLEFTGPELLISIIITMAYALTVFGKIKSGYWLIITCLALVIFEVVRLSFPAISYAYVIGNNVYISTFVSAVSFYFAYMFLGLSFVFNKTPQCITD